MDIYRGKPADMAALVAYDASPFDPPSSISIKRIRTQTTRGGFKE
jgi:hypothetical protein